MKLRQVQRHLVDEQLREQVLDLQKARSLGIVGGDRDMGAITQDVADEPGEVVVRADLDEDPCALVVQALDHFGEADPADVLAFHQLEDRPPIVREDVRARAREHGGDRLPELDLAEQRFERLRHRGHERRVIGPHQRQLQAQSACGRQLPGEVVDDRGGPEQHRLVGAVVHREPDVGLGGEDVEQGLPAQRPHRQQRTLGHRPVVHQLAENPVHFDDVAADRVLAEIGETGGDQRGILTGAVADDERRPDPQAGEHRKQRLVGEEHRLGAGVDLEQLAFEPLALVVAEVVGRRKHQHAVRDLTLSREQPLEHVEPLSRRRRRDREVPEHPGILGVLARKQERDRPLDRPIGEVEPVAADHPVDRAVGQPGEKLIQLLAQVGRVGGDDRRAMVARSGAADGFGGERGDGGRRPVLEPFPDGPDGGRQVVAGVGSEHQQDGGRGRAKGECRRRVDRLARARRFLQDHVRVDAAEPEGVDRGAARVQPRTDPRCRLGIEVERCRLQPEVGVDLVDQRRRQDLVVQGEACLDQRCGAGGGDAVADHRLDGAEGDVGVGSLAAAQDLAQRLDFGAVAERDAGAVRLHQTDGAGIDPALGIGALHRQHFALQARRHQSHGTAVGGGSDRLDHRVDAVVVAQRVIQPLEDDDSLSLAEQRAVGRLVERSDPRGPRQRLEHAEHRVDQRRGGGVDAARQHQVRPPEPQFGNRRFDRDQRGRAGGVHDEVGAHQVQPVGDAAGHHVGHQAGNRVDVELRQLRDQHRFDRRDLLRPGVGEQGADHVDRLVDDDRVLEAVDVGPVGVDGVAEDDAAAVRVEPGGVAGVRQGLGARLQGQELVGFTADDGDRHRSEGPRVELRQLVQEAAAGRVDADAAPLAGRVEEALVDQPSRRRIPDGVDLVENVAPEAADVGSPGKQPRHADDGDVAIAGRGHAESSRGRPRAQPPPRRLSSGLATVSQSSAW